MRGLVWGTLNLSSSLDIQVEMLNRQLGMTLELMRGDRARDVNLGIVSV